MRGTGIQPMIPRRGVEHGSGLGVYRWVVEQAFTLLHWFRRLRIRWEIRDDIHGAFLSIGCSIICWRPPQDQLIVLGVLSGRTFRRRGAGWRAA